MALRFSSSPLSSLRPASLLLLALGAFACNASEAHDGAGGRPRDDDGTGTTTSDATSTASTVTSSTHSASSATGDPIDVRDRLAAIPGVTVQEQDSNVPGYRYFDLTFDQPQDHDHPDGARFAQRVQLLHRAEDRPMVVQSSGYGLFGAAYPSEPTALIEGNQISVEHRFFAASFPAQPDWHHMNIRQSAADYHRITEALKPIYGARWISTGGSKGGMTSLYFRRFYPDDVDGTIAYVAPTSYGLRDPRYEAFVDEVGPAWCRDALEDYQIEVLSRRPAMRERVRALAQHGHDFSFLGEDAALDYAVLQVRFLLWQYRSVAACDEIPPRDASDDDLWLFLQQTSPVDGADQKNIVYFDPYYFQASTQLGDPAIEEAYLTPLLTFPGSDARDFVVPAPTKELVFDPAAMRDVEAWLRTAGERILFVYGENDPWTAGKVDVTGALDAHVYVAPGDNHGAQIASLTANDAAEARSHIARWAGIDATAAPDEATLSRARLAQLRDGASNARLRQRFEGLLDALSKAP